MKYQNVSGFRQMVVIEGKREVVFADDVIEVTHELFNAAFEKVSDSVEATYKPRTIRKSSDNGEKIALIQLEGKLKETANTADLTKLQATLEESKTQQVGELFQLRQEFVEFKNITLKRLEILKNVVKTLEYEVGQLYGEEESEGSIDSKTFRPE